MKKATIEVQDGETYTWEEAGFENGKVWDGSVNYHIWVTTNKDFIKTFAEDKDIHVKITDPDGSVARAVIKNEMSEKEIKEFLSSAEEGKEETPEEKPEKPEETVDEDVRYDINDNPYMTRLKNNAYVGNVKPRFQVAFVEMSKT